jgi:hypothetical protein
MHGILAAVLLLASAQTNISVTSQVGGNGTVTNHIETTVNGNTTTVESNQPGVIRVEKTDTSETITSDNPVTVTHSTDTVTRAPTNEKTREATKEATSAGKHISAPTYSYWTSLLRSLWDRVKNILSFGLLTRK